MSLNIGYHLSVELYFTPTQSSVPPPQSCIHQQHGHLWAGIWRHRVQRSLNRHPASPITHSPTGAECRLSVPQIPLSVSVYHPAINSCRPLTRHTPAAPHTPPFALPHSQHEHMFSLEHTPTHTGSVSTHTRASVPSQEQTHLN